MFKRIDDTTEIDTDFITCAEYQLFLDEMWDQEKYYQPDHWTEYNFTAYNFTAYSFFETTPKLSATDPVLGVRAEDAETFVNWLNKREKATYRLPTPAEAKKFPANIENTATWCYADKRFSLEGLSKLKYRRIEQKLKKLSTLPLSSCWINLFLSFPSYYYFDSALDRARARAFDLTRSLNLNLNCAEALDHARSRFLAHVHTRTPNLAPDRALHALYALAHDHAHDSVSKDSWFFSRQVFHTLLNKQQFDSILLRIQGLQNHLLSTERQRKLALFIDLIHCQTATTPLGIRQAFGKYAIHLLEYTWIVLNKWEKEKIVIRPWWQFWKRPSPKMAKTDYLEKEQKILELYWQLKIIEAREAGELPAWEGIRLVRVTSEQAL